MEFSNVARWGVAGMPNAGTDAYETFNNYINLNQVVSYDSDDPWFFQVTFSNLDSAKQYAFITTTNMNDIGYDGDGSSSRWTKFTILGADTYTNISSSGATRVSESIVKINSGYNTVNGYVVAWTGITVSDGSFIVRSENVGLNGPGEENESYGIQGFKFMELSD